MIIDFEHCKIFGFLIRYAWKFFPEENAVTQQRQLVNLLLGQDGTENSVIG